MRRVLLFAFVLLSLFLPMLFPGGALAQSTIPTPPPPPDLVPLPPVLPVTPPPIRIRPLPAPPRPIPVPSPEIKYHRVEVKIEGQVALTKVEMLFVNSSSIMLEGTYFYPLPVEAAISSLVMYADGQKMVGEIMEKEKASQIYESIVRQRRDPALLQYAGSRAVELKVFPLPPRGERKIQIEYSLVLKSDSGLIKYLYPLAGTSFQGSSLKELTLSIQLSAREAIRNVYSPTHEVGITRRSDRRVDASYEANNLSVFKDFELYYSLSDGEVGLSALTSRKDGRGYFLLLISPRLEVPRNKIVSRDIFLLVDVSGSMLGPKLEQAKEALKNILERINPEDRFNIIAFHSAASSYADSLQPVSEKRRALDYINGLRAAGGTNIHDALSLSLNMASEERQAIILLITDGRPSVGVTEEKGFLNLLQGKRRGLLRLFAFGIGDDVDTNLLDSLAQKSGGMGYYIKRDDEVKNTVTSFYEKISAPVLIDLRLDFGRIRVEEVYPNPLPDLYQGSQLRVVGRYTNDGEATITLRGRSAEKEEQFAYPRVNFAALDEHNSFIPNLWALQKVGYLMDQIRLHGPNKEVIDEVKSLSQQYGIMTPYTSYFIQEDMPEPVPVPLSRARPGSPGLRSQAAAAPGPAGPPNPIGKAAPARPSAPTTRTVPEPKTSAASVESSAREATAPVLRAPAIILFPGPAKGTLDIEGSGFTAGSAIQLQWENKRVPTVPGHISADESGKFKAAIAVPESKAGTYMITARDSSAEGTAARATFTIPEIMPEGKTSPISGQVLRPEEAAVTEKGPEAPIIKEAQAKGFTGLVQRLWSWLISLFK